MARRRGTAAGRAAAVAAALGALVLASGHAPRSEALAAAAGTSAADTAASLVPLPAFGAVPESQGSAVRARPLRAFAPPRHPYMAANGRSNLHEDAYQTDASPHPGPLGPVLAVNRYTVAGECASITFDRKGRLVTVCVGIDRPRLKLLEPRTLRELGTMDLPPRPTAPGADLFTNFAGGGYFRLLPYELIRRAVHHVNARERQPVVVFLHPWELDPDQPRLPATPLSRFRQYVNLAGTERKLDRLLRDFAFAPAWRVLAELGFVEVARGAPVGGP